MLNENKNKKNNDEIGIFNSLPIRGKDFVLDQLIKEDKDNLTDIQIDMETVMLNGDKEKARMNILHGNKYILSIFISNYLIKA
jgi:hypothetical protein